MALGNQSPEAARRAQDSRIAQQVARQFGLPPGLRLRGGPLGPMNQTDSRLFIEDNELFYVQNMLRIGNGRYRTLWDIGNPLFTAPDGKTIVSFFWFNIGASFFCVLFYSDGTADQVDTSGNRTVISATTGTFYKGSGTPLPVCCQAGASLLLIANNNTANDYWIWDSVLLYAPGTLGPIPTLTDTGDNYIAPPTVTAYGGVGSGAVLDARVNGGGVIAVDITNPGSGWGASDFVQVRFQGGGSDDSPVLTASLTATTVANIVVLAGGSGYTLAPSVNITGGGGSGAAATATITGGAVTLITLTNPGSNYTSAPTVMLTGGGGHGALAAATLVPQSVAGITVIDGSTNFTGVPTLTLKGGGGSGATATAIMSGPSPLASLSVVYGGNGYTSIPTVTITDPTGSGAQVSPVFSAGVLTSFVLINPGVNYTAPVVAITDPSGGVTGATATATVVAGVVTAIAITFGGTGYTSDPDIQIIGGGGSGATANATISGGSVTLITVTNGGTGYTSAPLVAIFGGGPGAVALATAAVGGGSIASAIVDLPGSGYSTAPAVVVQTGLNSAAAATIQLMPFGVSGTAMENFTGRVIIGPPALTGPGHLPNGGSFFVSAPASLLDFATTDGGLLYTTTDRFLRSQYTNFRQSNGYLYPFGDSSIAVISNVQTSGTPPLTSFTYQNIDPQSGTLWRDSCQDFSRTIIFANPLGIFGLYGGAVTKVSQKIERIFQNAFLPTAQWPTTGQPLIPSSAVANLYNMKCYVLLLEISNPLTEAIETAMLVWNERDWTVATSEANLIYIGTREIASQLTAWGTDGNALYQLFDQPSATLPKIIASKLYGADQPLLTKQSLAVYSQPVDIAGSGVTLDLTIESEMGGWLVPDDQGFKNWSGYVEENAGTPPTSPPVPNAPLLAARGLDVIGQQIGYTVSSLSADFELYHVTLAEVDVASVFG
jgi:hypothetical protein